MNKGLSTLVEKLRQEQEFVAFYKQQIRQSVQDLNSSCDQVFQSLWLSHTLSYGLHRVLTHNSHAYEWSRALSSADSVKFVNASKGVRSHLFVDRYSKFLTSLLNNPTLLSEILNLVESEGLDCAWVINDLMSVVYGHCVFRKDHTLYLELMRELLKQHIERCDSPKDLFGGVETVFNHVLSEYCSQLVELRTFLTMVLHDPLMQVLACQEYLEFDVNKAGSRFQHSSSEQNGLLGSSTFLFNEDLDTSCQKLAKLSTLFLENLVSMSVHFPVSLRWLLGNLKTMVKQKWPHISSGDLRRPVSDAIFSSILSLAIVNPDSFGVVDSSLIISEVGRYNLTQVMTVLQGCVWIMGKPTSSKYPIQKVVRRMDVNLFFSLVDDIDSGLTGGVPDLPSFLPGVHRSAFLASQEQLDHLVGLVAMLVTNRDGKGKFHSYVSNLLSCLLPTMIEHASRNPYPITTKSAVILSSPPASSAEPEKIKSLRRKRRTRKSASLEMLDDGGSSMHPSPGRGTIHTTPDGKSKNVGSDRNLKRSASSDAGFTFAPAGFRLPEQVLVFPVLEKLEEGVAQWDFYLLTEEEFMGQRSPRPKSDELSYFNSFLRSRSVPRSLEFDTPPGLRNNEQAEGTMVLVDKRVRSDCRPDSPKHDDNDDSNFSMTPPTSRGGQQSPMSRPLALSKEPRKLSTTFEASVEDYVKLHPPLMVNGSSVLPEEEGKGEEEGERTKVSRTEEVFPCLLRDEDHDVREGSPNSVDALELSRERVSGKSASSSPLRDDTSEERDRPPMGEGQNDSLVNLYQGEELGSPQLLGGKHNKKRKWNFFRKRKSLEERERETPKAERGQSDAPLKSKGVDFRVSPSEVLEVTLRSKIRSVSAETLMDKSVHSRRKVDRYTIYMQDYSTKLEESKRLSPKQKGEGLSTSQGSDEVDRGFTDGVLDRDGDATPPAEMTPLTFKQSLFCNQLKYKLRSALQHIHVPLTLNPALNSAFQQLHLQDGLSFNARYQLILLIQHSLQRTQWTQDDMETALLTEILRMVEPLPSELIEVTIDGVLESYHERSSYIAYLVCSQQKFQDAKLQVATVQEAILRIMQINTDLFVNFAMRTFLEAPSQPRPLQFSKFSQQMETLFLADEKCSLMNRCLTEFKAALREDSITWEHWEDREGVAASLGDYLFTAMHQHIFYPNGSTDKEVDKIFSDHLAALSKTISMTHKSLQIPFVYHSGCPWVAVQKQLRVMAAYKSPRGKLHCIVQSLRILISLLQYARCGDPPGADDLFPVLVYILIKANPPTMLSTCQYIRNFAESSLQGEDAYWWAQFSTAVEFTKTLS